MSSLIKKIIPPLRHTKIKGTEFHGCMSFNCASYSPHKSSQLLPVFLFFLSTSSLQLALRQRNCPLANRILPSRSLPESLTMLSLFSPETSSVLNTLNHPLMPSKPTTSLSIDLSPSLKSWAAPQYFSQYQHETSQETIPSRQALVHSTPLRILIHPSLSTSSISSHKFFYCSVSSDIQRFPTLPSVILNRFWVKTWVE